jgi:hypothetical protein
VAQAVELALRRALEVALATLRAGQRAPANWTHRVAVGLTGATGGMLGVAGLAVELPITTAIMLRSIADQARAHGEDLDRPATRLECLTVFSLGGPSTDDDAAESAYFATRFALAGALREASAYAAAGAAVGTAPPLVRLVAQIAARFGLAVEEKALAQLLPVIGALGGAAVNTVFMRHFQEMADAHFTVRELERSYGAEAVRAAYATA